MATHCLESVITTIAAGQLCQNVMHWQIVDPVETDLWKLAKNFNTALVSPAAGTPLWEALAGAMSSDAFISSFRARVLKPNPGTAAIKVWGEGDLPGTLSPDIYAQSVAGVIKWVTASGPDFTGRNFIPAVPEDAIIAGRFTADYIAAAVNFAGIALAEIETADGNWRLVVYKRITGTWEIVTNGMLVPNPGTIRKRLIPV